MRKREENKGEREKQLSRNFCEDITLPKFTFYRIAPGSGPSGGEMNDGGGSNLQLTRKLKQAPMFLSDELNQRQTKAGAVGITGIPVVHLPKLRQGIFDIFVSDPDTRISDGNKNTPAIILPGVQCDRAARIGEFDGI